MDIPIKYCELISLLEGRLFRIPNYQRSYSWEKTEQQDLFDDIIKTYQTDKQHFMATVVCLKRKNDVRKVGPKDYYIYDIVDGQQRLTTLVALLKAINLELKHGSNEERAEASDLDKLLVKGENKDLILLQTNHNEAEIFRDYLRYGVIPKSENIKTLAEKNLYGLFKECKKFIKTWKTNVNTSVIELLSVIYNRLSFILYQLEDEAIVYRVFEVLNSRGLDVNWLDKSKSVLMGLVYEKLEGSSSEYLSQLQYYWGEIYKVLGIRKINADEILTFAATLLLPIDRDKGKLLNTRDSLDLFKELSEIDIDNTLKIARTLLTTSIKHKDLSNIRELKFFYSISQSRFLYVSIMSNEILNEDEKAEILHYWEIVTFRIYGMMDRDAKKKVGDYVRLGREIFNNLVKNPFNPKEHIQEHKHFEALSLKDKIILRINRIGKNAPIEVAVNELIKRDCYNSWEDELRYFFYKYERYIAKKRNARIREDIWEGIFDSPITDSIEHIFPEKDPFDNWSGLMGSKKNAVEDNVNRLGNLLLLPANLNSRCGTKGFKDKVLVYKDALLHIANAVVYQEYIINGDTVERQVWDIDEIEKREKELIKTAKEIWV